MHPASPASLQPIAHCTADRAAALLALNNQHAEETSLLDEAAFHHMVGKAFSAQVVEDAAGFLIAFDERADYGSPNFRWFQDRLTRFVYVDRIVVSLDHRRRGIARLLYDDLVARAQAAGHCHLVCEVNLDPPNPQSDACHASYGFSEMGRVTLAGSGKTVRYLAKSLV